MQSAGGIFLLVLYLLDMGGRDPGSGKPQMDFVLKFLFFCCGFLIFLSCEKMGEASNMRVLAALSSSAIYLLIY